MVPFSRLCRGICMSSSSSFSFVASLCRRTPDDFNGSSFPSPFHPRSPQFKWALRCFPVCRYRTSSSSSSSSWSFCLSLFPVSSSRRTQLPSHRYALGFASSYLVNCQLFLPLLPLPLLFSSILWRVSAPCVNVPRGLFNALPCPTCYGSFISYMFPTVPLVSVLQCTRRYVPLFVTLSRSLRSLSAWCDVLCTFAHP